MLCAKGDEQDAGEKLFIDHGRGHRCRALGAMMLPKNSEVYQFTNDAASTIKQEAEKAIQSMTN